MGSWGIEIFEEDYALDWLADLCEHDDPKEFFEECLDIDDCDLELIECSGGLWHMCYDRRIAEWSQKDFAFRG